MGHYILSDDFDFDSVIIKSMDFNLNTGILSLILTYNDEHELKANVDLSGQFATNDYVANEINQALVPYSTTEQVGEQIAAALGEYDKSSVVTEKINTSIAHALQDYYNKSEVDTKVGNKNVNGVVATYNSLTDTINIKVNQTDGTSANGNVSIPNASTTINGLLNKNDKAKLDGVQNGANNYVLPKATATQLGGVKAGPKDDTYTVECKIGEDEKLYVTPGQYQLPFATPTRLGGVKPTAIKTSAYTTPVAVDAEGGLFTIPGNYVLPKATTTELGGVKIGDGINVDNEGRISAQQYTLPLASDSTRGGVKTGYVQNNKNYPVRLDNEKMYVEVPWTDTLYELPTASSETLGGVKIGEGVNINNGTISVATPKIAIDTSNLLESGTIKKANGEIILNNTGWVVVYGNFKHGPLKVDGVDVIKTDYAPSGFRDTYMMICAQGTVLYNGSDEDATYNVYGLK